MSCQVNSPAALHPEKGSLEPTGCSYMNGEKRTFRPYDFLLHTRTTFRIRHHLKKRFFQ